MLVSKYISRLPKKGSNVSPKPISKVILDLDDPSYALSPKSLDDPRTPLRHPNHRSHEDYKDDQKEQ
jgi:hypothetical protein